MGMAGACLYLTVHLTQVVAPLYLPMVRLDLCLSVEEAISHYWVCMKINLEELFHSIDLPDLKAQSSRVHCSGDTAQAPWFGFIGITWGAFTTHRCLSQNPESDPPEAVGLGKFGLMCIKE